MKEKIVVKNPLNQEVYESYNKIKKEYIKVHQLSYEEIRDMLDNGKNIYLYSQYGKGDCEICHKNELNIIDVEKEDDFLVITVYCENCHEYSKFYYLNGKRVKDEYYMEKVEKFVSNKDHRRFNKFNSLKNFNYNHDIFFLGKHYYIIIGILCSALAYALSYLLLNESFVINLVLSLPVFIIFHILGMYINQYNSLIDTIGYKKYFFLSNEENLVGDNLICIKYKEEVKANSYSDTYLELQRDKYSLSRLVKIYNVLIAYNKVKMNEYKGEMDTYLVNHDEDESRLLFVKFYELETINNNYSFEINNLLINIKDYEQEMMEERKKKNYYDLDFKAQQILLGKSELDIFEIDEKFENYKANLLSNQDISDNNSKEVKIK